MLKNASEGAGSILGAAITGVVFFCVLLFFGFVSRGFYEVWNLGYTLFGYLN